MNVTPRLEEVKLFRLQQESKNIVAPTEQGENSLKKNAREKRKPVSNLTDEQLPGKKQKDMAQNLKKTSEKNKAQAKQLIHEVEDIRKNTDKPDRASENQTNHNPGKPRQYKDQCTAFISNLSLKATNKDLQDFFSDVGGVAAIRILTDKFTKKSRGLAYVDFSDNAHLAAAVAKNKHNLLGKSLSIARSDPNQRKKRGSAGDSVQTAYGNSERTRKGGHGDDTVQLQGKNTFAVPRAVRPLPLGWTTKGKQKTEGSEEGGGDEKPISNDEFRKMFLKA
ncbi:unnamed protein product [Ilex paraguariensis]|uniref:RRM domain-containing protein n=1 Tax=Ilex paraguariensis TaxID=185542 RepID=A0ABC8U7F6_9AQUA